MNRKPSLSLRLAGVIACIILTAISVVGTKHLWCQKGTTVDIEFSCQKDLDLQVFYCSESDKNFSEKHSVKQRIHKEQKKTSIFIPATSNITRFRLDLGSNPELFKISEIAVNGKNLFHLDKLDLEQFIPVNITSYAVKEGKGVVVSTHRDPFLIYKNALNIAPGLHIEWLILITFCIVSYFFASKAVKYLLNFKIFGSFPRRDIYFLTAFFVLLFLPMLHINDEEISIKENRTLARKPGLSRIYDEKYRYGNLFESWYSDRFFGRDFLIMVHNRVGWGQPKKGNEKVLLGADGWMFYKGNFNELDFRNEHPASSEDLEKSVNYIVHLSEWCKRNNKKFYFFVAPNKHRVYGEFYRYVHKQTPDNLSMANRFLCKARAKGIDAIYPLDALLEAKNNGQLLYWKHDTHWNPRGAYIGYLALMQKISKDDNSIKKVEPNFIPCSAAAFEREMEAMYPNITPDDISLYVQHKTNPEIRTNREGSRYNSTFTQVNPRKTGKVVVYRDSFTTAMAPYLSETFGEITYIWRYDAHEEDYEKHLKQADIVILETVERYIPNIGKNAFNLK